MNVAAVRERLLRGTARAGSRAAARRGGRRLVNGTYIVGERMTPLGCDCRAYLLPAALPPQHTHSMSSSSASHPAVQRRRVTLPGMLPGLVVRTPEQYFDSIVHDQALPRQAHRIKVLRQERIAATVTAHRPTREEDDEQQAARTRLQKLPCSFAAQHQCVHCPWIALGARLSSQMKEAVLRRAMSSACGLHRAGNAPAWRVGYCEPFVVPVQTNRQQEVGFVFVPDAASRTASAHGGAFALDGSSASTSSAVATQACILCTLEQKRLCEGLTRWAHTLPTSARESLRAAYVLQPAHTVDAGQPWQSDLIVTLYLTRSSESGSVQESEQHSPLCGPSHPADLLAIHEQSFVETVLAAAPLIATIEVHVCFSDGGCERLYPRLVRHLTLAELSTHKLPQEQEGKQAAGRRSIALPLRCCRCYCCVGSSEGAALAIANLPLCHSALWWRHGRPCAPQGDSKAHSTVSMTVPSMWRHCGALESVCSLLLSLLCEPRSTKSETSSAAAAMSLWYYDTYGVHDRERCGSTSAMQEQAEHDHTRALHGRRRHTAAYRSKYAGRPGVANVDAGTFLLATTLRAAMQPVGQLPYFSAVHTWPAKTKSAGKDVQAECDVILAVLAEDGGSSCSNATHIHALLTHLAQVQQQQRQEGEGAKGRHVRLVLVCCSTDMTLQPLQDVLAQLCHSTASSLWRVTNVSCGVIDVDVLAASFVAYSVVDATLS